MPIILAVNGVTESYPMGKAIEHRHARVESVEAQDSESQRHSSSLDRSILAAQSAYQRQSSQGQHPRPVTLAQDLMTTPAISLPSDSTVLDAWTIMSHKGFRHIPITSLHGTVVGMVSDRDLLRHVPELVLQATARQGAQRKLADIMTSRVISATPTTDIREIARVMLDERIHAVPILDHNRHLVGILSRHDLLQGIANHGPLELWT